MQRINTPTAVGGLFVPGNPGTGQPPTQFSADWCNAVQEEIANAIEGAGLALNPNNPAQLLEAIGILTGKNASAFKNEVVNGDFQVWQRGESHNIGAAANRYSADRWLASAGSPLGSGQAIVSRQSHTQGQDQVPGNPVNYLRFSQVAPSDTTKPFLRTTLEDVRRFSSALRRFSFYAKVSSQTTIGVRGWMNYGSGGSASVPVADYSAVLTPTWQRFSFQLELPDVSSASIGNDNGLQLQLEFPLAWSQIVDISDVQLEEGFVATGFERLPYQVVLSLCERYYEKSYASNLAPGANSAAGARYAYTGGTVLHTLATPFRTRKRVSPVVTWYAPVSGTPARVVELDTGNEVTVTGNPQVTDSNTGAPQVGASQGNDYYYAHWTADAEFGTAA